jgi:hypothetical protein
MRKKWIEQPLNYSIATRDDKSLKVSLYITEDTLLLWMAIVYILESEFVDAVVFPTKDSPMRFELRRVDEGESYLDVSRPDRRVLLGISRYNLETCIGQFVGHYFVLGKAAVPMDHFEFPSRTSSVPNAEDSVAVYAEHHVPPIPQEEAERLLLQAKRKERRKRRQ